MKPFFIVAGLFLLILIASVSAIPDGGPAPGYTGNGSGGDLSLNSSEGDEVYPGMVESSGLLLRAQFSATPLTGYAPLAVRFTDLSTGIPLAWQWEFGDGNSSSDQNPEHIYSSPGKFVVRLTVSYSTGNSSSQSVIWVRKKPVYVPVTPSPTVPPTVQPTPDGRNDATSYTIAANREANNTPAWANGEEDFDFANRGFLASDEPLIIPSPLPNFSAWNMEAYRFLNNGTGSDTIHPLLYRQARLNNIHGLFAVTDRIYQIRGYDLSVITFVKGDTGWIIIDPMTSVEPARAALALVNRTLGDYPVRAVIYSHPHVDHYQGVKGVTTAEAVAAGDVEIIAPVHFMDHALAENVYAGNAMQRRAVYQYGQLLPKDEKGQVDVGIGKYPSSGSTSLIAPTTDISYTGQEVTIDGVRMVFQFAVDTEAPVELNIWFPEERALFMAENCVGTLHNVLTLRGAQVRDPLAWSENLDEARRLYGDEAEVVFSAHNWPRFGNDKVVELLENQRDMYKYINDQTLNLINKGYTMDEISNMIELPDSLEQYWYTHGFYGQLYMGVKATYQKYLGFYDANPVNLNRLPPEEFATQVTRYMGGAGAVLPRLRADYDAGNYQLVASIAQYLVFADPANWEARELEADALEQLGYQAESGTARNAYLTAAKELRSRDPVRGRTTISQDIMSAMTVPQLLDFLSVRVNSGKAAGQNFRMNLELTDTGDTALIQVKNSVLYYWEGESSPAADVSVRMPRKTLEQLALDPSVSLSSVETTGDSATWNRFVGMLDVFDPGFNIMIP
jgi:alkyl sulfatase BDS1-like metallo-beta-lactamase superfamily hydrolase